MTLNPAYGTGISAGIPGIDVDSANDSIEGTHMTVIKIA